MFLEIDPARLIPMPGKMVVQIVEVLGGLTRGGVFVPGTTQDHSGKDTVTVKVLTKGPAPRRRIVGDAGNREYADCAPHPESYRPINVGDIVVMPRDVPLVFVHGEHRYAIVLEDEGIVAISAEEFEASGFEVVPWTPSEIPTLPS